MTGIVHTYRYVYKTIDNVPRGTYRQNVKVFHVEHYTAFHAGYLAPSRPIYN